jgi:spoIIIJ-associated protein
VEDGVEFSGRTVDDAVAAAESRLGVRREDLIIEVLSAGSRGVFGIGAENARILVRRPAPAPAPVTSAPQAPESVAQAGFEQPAEAREPQTSTAVAEVEEPAAVAQDEVSVNGADLADSAQEVLARLLDTMGFDAEVHVRHAETPVVLEVTGDNLGVLIGRRGDNLSALQFMVNLILSKHRRQWPRVIVDVENYRARREESLRSLAERTAYRVRRNGRPFTLEAMPASDRRIIHLALRDRSDVETYSIGEGPARRVVIAPKRAARDDRY